ncbi:hypothetical protein MMIC_P1138 [Mariprofundus micogutta]|uniref:DUF2799 domain-containing protein n=1 Tax=Mariprofundus micogutta TaxID=1921010 RepID=A0A1L8CMQ3_9PROT|nr:DUF2799 domain-containing protein [Mariprofundus micogutta]GAV20176.1 hypothetical protein MMIC_P1138 [Mariprofundus micogutta]
MKRILLLSMCIVPFVLMGCASLDKEQCMQGDWYHIGHQDGSSGKQTSRINNHNSACEEYGIAVNQIEYMQGWKHGIRNYCTAASGFSLGRRGTEYNRVCPAELEIDFVAGYREGLETLLDETQWEYDTNERELNRYSRQLSRATSESDRAELKKEVKEHDNEHDRLEKRIHQLMKRLSMARQRELYLR